MDAECVNICDAINKIPGLRTLESCCGHGDYPFRIWFLIDDPRTLPMLLYFCDPCHVGFRWDCKVTTDCAMSPVHYRIESLEIGEEAYLQAEVIATEVQEFLEGESFKQFSKDYLGG